MNTAIASLAPAKQRALAVALFVVAVALGLAIVVVPVVLIFRHYDETIATLTDRLHRLRTIAAQAPSYRQALETMRTREARRFFLKNSAPNLAAAELQELVRGAIETNGGRITTSQNMASKDDGRFRQIGVTVQFFANTPNLQKVLYALETQLPYIAVENLTLRPLNAFRGFKPAPGQEPELNVQLEASAHAFAESAKK
jgi:general secretion pathway protein M